MNEQAIDDIKNSLRELMQLVTQRGEPLSDELKLKLAQVMEHAANRIKQIREVINNGPGANGKQPLPQGTDLLWILSGGDENAFTNYLRTFPGEGFQELAANPNRLAQVIAEFQQNNPINPDKGEGADGIPNVQFPSSNVVGMKYDPKSAKLLVKFHGKNKEPVYQYDSVPPQIFKLLQHGNAFAQTQGKNQWGQWWKMKNPSVGASINQYLKAGGYAYRRLR